MADSNLSTGVFLPALNSLEVELAVRALGRPRIYPTRALRQSAHNARVKAERERRKAAGQCPMCRTPVAWRYVYCLECRRIRMANWRRWYRTHGRAA